MKRFFAIIIALLPCVAVWYFVGASDSPHAVSTSTKPRVVKIIRGTTGLVPAIGGDFTRNQWDIGHTNFAYSHNDKHPEGWKVSKRTAQSCRVFAPLNAPLGRSVIAWKVGGVCYYGEFEVTR